MKVSNMTSSNGNSVPNQFLGEGIAETRKKIKSGVYTLADLNQRS